MNKKKTYEEAMSQLEKTVNEIESGELPVSDLVERVKEARRLIDYCDSCLKSVENDVKKLLDDEQE